jgi:hypothetical protein
MWTTPKSGVGGVQHTSGSVTYPLALSLSLLSYMWTAPKSGVAGVQHTSGSVTYPLALSLSLFELHVGSV